MQRPYVGITGFMTQGEALSVLNSISVSTDRLIMIGVLASQKTVFWGMQNKWPNRYPTPKDISGIFPSHPFSLNLVHYNTKEPETLLEQMLGVTRLGGPNFQGFQLNVKWPSPIVVGVIRPEWRWNVHDIFFLSNEWLVVVIFVVIGFLSVWLHEIIHGVFFLLFTCKKPKISFSVFHALCAAPGWYLPVDRYLIVVLAPFILLTTLGIVALNLVPSVFVPCLLFVLFLNGSGSMGDIWVAIKILRYGHRYNIMITDWGTGCAIYAK